VSVAAADAIWKRIEAAGFTTPKTILAASDHELRSVGLSRQKSRYAKALSEADIDYQGLRTLSSEDIILKLTKVSGIGVWTAEIYAMFSLGRADVFASGDLALQESVRILFDLPERPKEKNSEQCLRIGNLGGRLPPGYCGSITVMSNHERVLSDACFKFWTQRASFGKYTISCCISTWLWCEWCRFIGHRRCTE
jgi:hypothetical protein